VPAETYRAVAAILAFVYRVLIVTGLLRFGLREVPHETAAPAAAPAPAPGSAPRSDLLLAVAVLGVVALIDSALRRRRA